MPMFIAAALLLAVFAQGQGKPGTYTTRDNPPRTFMAGSRVPKDLNAEDLKQWKKDGYIVTEEQPTVREVGGVAHDVPPGTEKTADATRSARRPRSTTESGATVPRSSLREDPTVADPDGDLDAASATDPEGVADDAEEADRGDAENPEDRGEEPEEPATTTTGRQGSRATTPAGTVRARTVPPSTGEGEAEATGGTRTGKGKRTR